LFFICATNFDLCCLKDILPTSSQVYELYRVRIKIRYVSDGISEVYSINMASDVSVMFQLLLCYIKFL